MQFVLPNASYSISDIISERMWDEGHKNNILSTTQDIGIGFADWLVVVDFAQ
jgi:hypothetical protein